MARPSPDVEARRAALIKAAQQVLRTQRGRRLIMADVAAEAGMSQSSAYRFFADKNALIEALAADWFSEVNSAVRHAVHQAGPIEARLWSFVQVQMRIKKKRFDDDPVLFRANLELVADHMHVVLAHVKVMRDLLLGLMVEYIGKARAAHAAQVFDDATHMFRDPLNIARWPPDMTESRAREVVTAVLSGLSR